MTQSILIIDDESAVLNVATLILEEAAYKVTPFVSAVEAIAYYSINQHNIHVILLDVSMTEMNGIQCAKALRDINDQATIVLSSGHDLEDIMQGHQDIQFQAFLQKPYRPQALIEKIQAALSASQPSAQPA